LGEPHFVLFCFHLLFLSILEVQPFVGGHPFCVVLFSFVLKCPVTVPWSSTVVVVPYFVLFFFGSFNFCIPGCYPQWCGLSVGLISLSPLWWGVCCGSCWGVFTSLGLIDCRLVGVPWCVMWHINLYPGRKKRLKLPSFALSVPWR
jgi:hypothetical protein